MLEIKSLVQGFLRKKGNQMVVNQQELNLKKIIRLSNEDDWTD